MWRCRSRRHGHNASAPLTEQKIGEALETVSTPVFFPPPLSADGAMVCDIVDLGAGTLSLASDVLNFLSESRRSAPFRRR